MAQEHEHSILYEPFNHTVSKVVGREVHVPDHVIMALLVLLISCIVFPLMRRKISRDNPSGFQHVLELVVEDRKSIRLNSSHSQISYAVFCLKKKKKN